jgi:hypothetical protein
MKAASFLHCCITVLIHYTHLAEMVQQEIGIFVKIFIILPRVVGEPDFMDLSL